MYSVPINYMLHKKGSSDKIHAQKNTCMNVYGPDIQHEVCALKEK